MRVTRGRVEELDAILASLARGEAALRLRLGQALEVLAGGGVFSLGFSSVGAYAVERCERSVRWGEAARCLARRVEVLPRDRFRCMSPVCPRRDVTPHHLVFRSAGGSDEDENIGSICTWCHLHGIHGGRIRARGPARCIRWELGARGSPCIVVHGRERLAA